MPAADRNGSADTTGTKRKLAAILHADVVGYSRLMGEDEVGTHARLMAYRERIDELILRRDGRIVGTAGDAVLSDFPSVVEALTAATEIQDALAERNASLPPEQKLEFRIGINLGDVIVEGDDIFGDGVNVAARVEALAEPGGIAISGPVYDQVKNKLELAFHDQGLHRVKNIADPIRVYGVALGAGATSGTKRRGGRRRWLAAALAALVALAGGLAFWMLGSGTDREQQAALSESETLSGDALPSPGKPTIAVLPFEDRGGVAADDYFIDGVTEDVIIDLGRFSNLLVLSWNAVAPYKGKTVELPDLSRELDVRYVVGGTVRRAGEQLRITVQLTDAQRGVLLWSERYDSDLEDLFAVQDRIAREVVGTLAVQLTKLEQDRAFEKPTENLDAYDRVLRGRALMRRIERATNVQARELFEGARSLDARYVDAMVGLGLTHIYDFWFGWTEWPHQSIEEARLLAEQAIGLDERDAPAHALLASALTYQGDFAQAEQVIARAIELNPNNPMGLAIRGMINQWSGRPDEAIRSLELALRLDPRPITWWLVSLGQSYYLMNRYEEAVALVAPLQGQATENPATFALLAAAYGQLGQQDQAATVLASLKRISPFFDPELYAGNMVDPNHARHLLEGLRKAGLE